MQAQLSSRVRGRALIATLLALGLLLAGAASASARVPRDFFGVMPQAALHTADVEHMGEAKVGTLRISIDWHAIDPSPAAGDYNFNTTDALVREAAQQHIRVLPYIFGTPGWVAKDEGSNCDTAANQCGTYAPHTPEGLADWKTFVTDVARRYGPSGVFWQQNPNLPSDPIRAWQIWNEQNSPSFYQPKPNVARYEKLLKAAHEGIRSADPGADVLVGGMFRSPLGGRKPGIFAEKFLAKLYDIRGAKKYFEGISVHPYAAKMTKVIAQIDLIREAIKDAHDSRTPLWITEIGWASSGPNNPLVRGAKGQAARLKEAFDYFLDKRRAYKLQTVLWYSWQDNPNPDAGLCEWCSGSGLLTKSGAEKPSYKAFVGYTGGR